MTADRETGIFDEVLVERHRARAVMREGEGHPLRLLSQDSLKDRLLDVKKTFLRPVFIGQAWPEYPNAKTLSVAAIREGAAQDADLIISDLFLHSINGLPDFLHVVCESLAEGGVFLASLFGGESLAELRQALIAAEIELSGGASPRVAPMISLVDAGGLLSAAGFALPVADREKTTLVYPDLRSIMLDLRALGETNALLDRLRTPTPRALFAKAEKIYRQQYENKEGKLPATFDILYLCGWKN
jgi:SAM-dependent methyltransferase